MQCKNGDFIYSIASSVPFSPYYLGDEMIVVRSDSLLNIKWKKKFVQSGPFIAMYLESVELNNDTIAVFGLSYDTNYASAYPSIYYWFTKMDTSGNIYDTKLFYTTNKLRLNHIQKSNYNHIIVYGREIVVPNIDERMVILEFDQNFNPLWNKQYKFSEIDDIKSVRSYLENGYVIQAHSLNPLDTIFTRNTLLFRIDSVGNILWAQRTGNLLPTANNGSDDVDYGQVIVEANGNIVNSFTTEAFVPYTYYDILIQRLDSLGSELNTMRFGNFTTQYDYFNNLLLKPNGNFILHFNSFRYIEMDSNFNQLWYKRMYPAQLPAQFEDDLILNNGALVLLGITQSSFNSLLIMTDSLGSIGCDQFIYNTFPQQVVSFPNTDITGSISINSNLIFDSLITLSIQNAFLKDSVICNTATYFQQFHDDKIQIYPTVTNYKIVVENNNDLNLNVFIYDLKGTLKLQSMLDKNEVDVSVLTEGLYLLRLSNENQIFNFKFIKL